MAVVETVGSVRIIDREEGMRLLDAAARRYLGISGEEFLRDWDAGKFGDPDGTEVMNVVSLIPFAR